MIPLIFSSFFLVFGVVPAIIIVVSTNKEYEHIDKNGILVNAIVTKNIRRRRKKYRIYYTTKVRYTGIDGEEHESELFHSDGIAVGTYVNIRYVPGEYKTVLLVENPQ